jgi:cob(I)alamin adenosyltransferase
MKIYTKTGDDGTTSLLSGVRVPKHSLRVEAYGTVDELNSLIGVVMAQDLSIELFKPLKEISSTLFMLGADLATPGTEDKGKTRRIMNGDVRKLEHLIDDYTAQLPTLKNFILPGGSPAAAHLHHARSVCRRAERLATALAQEEPEEVNEEVIKFLNRLSDLLFTAARLANKLAGRPDVKWIQQ